MSESHTLVKVLAFVGIVLFIGSLMSYNGNPSNWVYVGQPVPADSTWGQFSAQVESFPAFVNPFALTSIAVTRAVANGIYAPLGGVNCLPATYWYGCLSPPGTHHIYADTGHPNFTVRLGPVGGVPDLGRVAFVQIGLGCNATGGDGNVFVYLAHAEPINPSNVSTFFYEGSVICPVGSTRGLVYSNDTQAVNSNFVASDFSNVYAYVIHSLGSGNTSYNNLFVAIGVSWQQNCGAIVDFLGQVACNISNFVQAIISGFLFAANFLVFIVAVLFWFVGLVGMFFLALFGLLGAGGAPPLIAAPIGILILGCIFFVAFVIMGKVRGTGNVG